MITLKYHEPKQNSTVKLQVYILEFQTSTLTCFRDKMYMCINFTYMEGEKTDREREEKTLKNKILIFTLTFSGHLVPSFLYISLLLRLT